MKKRITKIWGIGLVVVLAASLLFGAVPASAGDLSWGTETIPTTTGSVLTDNVSMNVADFSIADDGVIYMVTGEDFSCYKSTNGGKTWSKLPKSFGVALDFVAVAPDDSSIVVVAETTGTPNIWVSTDGGSTFGDLGNAVDTGTGADTLASIKDLAISYADSAKHYIGVAGTSSGNATSKAGVFYFDLGASAPKWNATILDGGFRDNELVAFAVAFSPNVASDKVMVAVTSDTTATTGDVYFQIYSLSTKVWNQEAAFSGYPVNIQNGSDNIDAADGGAIALAPDYLGSDDSLRIAFVGLATGTAYAGVYRLKDTSVKDIYDGSGYDIYSLAFDGTNLVAGNSLNTKVYRSDNPLATSPDFSTASEQKRPGLSTCTNTIVAWSGADVLAGTTGPGSCFAISRDNGKSFNDISMIDSAGSVGTMLDVAVSADGSKVYMLTDDSSTLSLWRNIGGSWERVLSVASFADNDGIVRLAPEDPDSVYVADEGAKTIYYSQEGGETKWFIRTSANNIGDLAVESADVAYVAVAAAKTVSKTTNSGFIWGTAKDTGVGGSSIDMIRSLGEDEVIVGSDGYVAWSTDGNSSWSKVNTQLYGTANLTQVTASGLADGDYIYAATSTGGSRVERWEIGQSGTSWKNLDAPMTARGAYGLALVDGVLYVQTFDTTGLGKSVTLRTLSPTDSEPSSGMWSTPSTVAAKFWATPQSLKTSTGSTKLWSVSANTSALYSYNDTLATVGPTLAAPGDGGAVKMNPVSGGSYAITLSWERLSKSTNYDIQVATDSGFVEKIISTDYATVTATTGTTASTPAVNLVAGFLNPGTTYYWRIRTNIAGPVRSQWSATRSFIVAELPEAQPPVIIEQPPAPVISVPPAPAITLQPPEIVLPPQPAPPPEIVLPAPVEAAPPIPPWALYVIIIIGAVLVIALIVLIMRTRRPV